MMLYAKVESLAACRMSEQPITDVLDIDLAGIKKEHSEITLIREAIRKGWAKGEAEIRAALYRKAKSGDACAYHELQKREKQQGGD